MTGAPQDKMFRHSFLLLALSNVANVMNLLFQALMGNILPNTEYRQMYSMMTLMLIVTTTLEAVRTWMAHTSAVGVEAGRPWVARELVSQWLVRLVAVAAIALAVGLLVSPWLADYANMSTVWPARLTVCVAGIMLLSPLLIGTYQGVQFFFWMSAAMGAWSILRLTLGYVFVRFVSPTATSALASHVISFTAGLLISAWGLRYLPRRPVDAEPSRHPLGGYFYQSLFMLAGYALLTYADLLLVSHYFEKDADRFAQAALIGRSVVFLPIPIAMAMFPKVVSVGASSRRTLITFLKALGMAVAIIGAAVLGCTLLTWLPLRIMFGIMVPTVEQIHLARTVLWAMAPLSLTYMLMNFEMAQHRFTALPFIWFCAIGYIGGVALFHDTISQFVMILGTVSTVSAIAFIALIIRAHLRKT